MLPYGGPMPGRFSSSRWLLLVLLLFWGAQNLWAATQPWSPDALSEGLNLEYAEKARRALSELGQADDALDRLCYQGFPYGPMVYVASAVVETITGWHPLSGLLVIQLFAVLAILGAAELTWRLSGSREAGLWAAGLLAVSPMWLYYARHFTTDTALGACLVALCIGLPATAGFSRRRPSVLVGALLGLGLLIKVTVLHLAAGAFALYLLMTVVYGHRFPGDLAPQEPGRLGRLRLALPNLSLALGIAALIAAPYYRFYDHYTVSIQLERYEFGLAASWGLLPTAAYPTTGTERLSDWLFFYPRIAMKWQLGLPLLLVMVWATGLACLRRVPGARWLVGIVLLGLGLFTATAIKKWYYTVPLLPLFAVVAGMGLAVAMEAMRPSLRRLARGGLVALLATVFFTSGWVGASNILWNEPALLRVAPTRSPGDTQALANRLLGAVVADHETLDPRQREGKFLVVSEEPSKQATAKGHGCLTSLAHSLETGLARQAPELDLRGADNLRELAHYMERRDLRYVLWAGPQGKDWLDEDSPMLGPASSRDSEDVQSVIRNEQRLATRARGSCGPLAIRLARVGKRLP